MNQAKEPLTINAIASAFGRTPDSRVQVENGGKLLPAWILDGCELVYDGATCRIRIPGEFGESTIAFSVEAAEVASRSENKR